MLEYEFDRRIRVLSDIPTILEFVSDGIYVVDHRAITMYVNQAYEEISGARREELLGRHMQKLTDEGYFNQSVSLLVLKEKRKISLIQKLGKDKKDAIVTGNPIFDENGQIAYVVTSVRDITNLNHLKDELQRAEKFSEIQQHRYIFDLEGAHTPSILYKSDIMHEIITKVEQIAAFPTSVLISGPSGVGKEEVANLLHHLSDRRDKPIIKINCAAIPETLLESELFGYEEGAFTGSKKTGKMGLLELANGGTFMLDEISEMPLSLQVKLLRVIQEREVKRIGGTEPIKLDIRFISATNQDLEEKIRVGTFRADLYYRLKVVELYIPPLKERREDILPLAEHFFVTLKKKYRVEKEMATTTKTALQTYDWPGNVRELKNVIENILVSVPDYLLQPEHLPNTFIDQAVTTETSLREQVQLYEKALIDHAIKQHGSVRKAAKILQVHHSTIVKKRKTWKKRDE